MTKLEQAFAEAAKLTDSEQDALAAWILEELASEKRWSEAFARSQDALGELADEALAVTTNATQQIADRRLRGPV